MSLFQEEKHITQIICLFISDQYFVRERCPPPLPLLPVVCEGADPPLTSCSTWENGACTFWGQQNKADPNDKGVESKGDGALPLICRMPAPCACRRWESCP